MNRVAVAKELVKLARCLASLPDEDSDDMSLEEMDEQAAQLGRDLEANGWYEHGGIGFYSHRSHPLIFVDNNGVVGAIRGKSRGDLMEEFVDTYDDVKKFLNSREYKGWLKYKELVAEIEKSPLWKPYASQNYHQYSDTYVSDSFPGIFAKISAHEFSGQRAGDILIGTLDKRHGGEPNLYRGDRLGVVHSISELNSKAKQLSEKAST